MSVIERSTPPVAATLPRVRIPRYERAELSNGLRVVLLEDPRFPSISLRLGLPGGNKLDPPARTGIAEMLASMLTDGTPQRSAKDLAEESAQIGAQFHFSASDDFYVGAGTVLEDTFEPFLGLFTECLLESTFPPEELALRKQNRLHELMVERSEAGYWADARMYELAFGTHPYSVTSPEPEHVAALTREDLMAMGRDALLPAEASLVLVGDLPERGHLLAMLEATLGRWRGGGSGMARRGTEAMDDGSGKAGTIHVIHRAGSVQAEVRLGRPAPARLHPDYIALNFLNTLLGGGASSRLFTEIREKQGLAYHVSSSYSALVEGGILALTTQVAMDRVGDAVRGLKHELRRLLEEPVPDEELASVRNYISGTFVLRLESHASLANQISGIQLLGLGDDYLETYTSRVAAVTSGQLREIAARYFTPDGFALVVAGDANVLAPQLEGFGDVTVSEPGAPS